MICSSQKSDEMRRCLRALQLHSLRKDIFVCGPHREALWMPSNSPKQPEKSHHTTNHFTSSSSKLAISSHATTCVNQSFRWFNGVIKFPPSSRLLTKDFMNIESERKATRERHRDPEVKDLSGFQGSARWRKNENWNLFISAFFLVGLTKHMLFRGGGWCGENFRNGRRKKKRENLFLVEPRQNT